MAYIGNTQQNQNYVPAIDYFSGNGSTTAFTLSRPVASVAQVQAVIENVPQNPGDAYTVSGNTITFTSAPPSGTNNIYIYYTSPNTQVTALPQSPVVYGNLNFGSTGARIQGDFTNATLANRVMFQTSTTNGATNVYAIPNGTGTTAGYTLTNNSDPSNAGITQVVALSTESSLRAAITGTGSYLPMTFYTGGTERMRIDTSGNVGIGTSNPTSPLVLYRNSATSVSINCGNSINSWLSGIDSSGNFANYTNGAYNYIISTSGTERMRITSNGGIAFGGASNYGTSGQVLTSNGDAPPSWGSASSIGVGQTWQNVAGSRALNTTYTNSTGRAIMVSVTVNSTVAAGFNMRFFVDGVVMAADGNSQTASTYSTGSTQVIVPNGSTYYVPSAALSNGAGAILYWFELR